MLKKCSYEYEFKWEESIKTETDRMRRISLDLSSLREGTAVVIMQIWNFPFL